MSKMGFLGAVGGAGGAMASMAMSDIEEAKQVRLENLRTQNNQATNTLSNTERHENSLVEREASHGYSLAELAERDKNETSQKQFDIDNEASYSDVPNETGGVPTQQVNNRTGEKQNIPGGYANASSRPPAEAYMVQFYESRGHSPEKAEQMARANANKPKGDAILDIYGVISKNAAGSLDPNAQKTTDEMMTEAESIYERAHGGGLQSVGGELSTQEEYLKANPEVWEQYEAKYGELPSWFEKP